MLFHLRTHITVAGNVNVLINYSDSFPDKFRGQRFIHQPLCNTGSQHGGVGYGKEYRAERGEDTIFKFRVGREAVEAKSPLRRTNSRNAQTVVSPATGNESEVIRSFSCRSVSYRSLK